MATSVTLDGITFTDTAFAQLGYLNLITVNGTPYPGWQALWVAGMIDVNSGAASALASATAAAASALTATTSAATQGTSTTSLTIGTGSQNLTVQTGKGFLAGMPVRIADSAAPSTAYMDGTVTSYNGATGALVVAVTAITGSGTIATWNVFLEGPISASTTTTLLGKLAGANLNSTADQAITPVGGALPAKYMVTEIIATNASGSPTTAVGGLYSSASKGGQAIVYAGQTYSALTSSAALAILAMGAGAKEIAYTASSLFFSLTTPQGSAMTCDIYVFGAALP